MTTKKTHAEKLADIRERTELMRRVAELEARNLELEEAAARHGMEVSTLNRQVANLKVDCQMHLERLEWVRELTDGRGRRPKDLTDKGTGHR